MPIRDVAAAEVRTAARLRSGAFLRKTKKIPTDGAGSFHYFTAVLSLFFSARLPFCGLYPLK
jgi:hypothetical protein